MILFIIVIICVDFGGYCLLVIIVCKRAVMLIYGVHTDDGCARLLGCHMHFKRFIQCYISVSHFDFRDYSTNGNVTIRMHNRLQFYFSVSAFLNLFILYNNKMQ